MNIERLIRESAPAPSGRVVTMVFLSSQLPAPLLGEQVTQQRQGEKAVGDRAAEAGRCSSLRIDVDELLILGRGAKGVDAGLVDGQPAGDPDFLSYTGADVFERR